MNTRQLSCAQFAGRRTTEVGKSEKDAGAWKEELYARRKVAWAHGKDMGRGKWGANRGLAVSPQQRGAELVELADWL